MPDIIQPAWQAWKRVGQTIGDLTARIILSVFYFTILLPFGVGVRLLSDPLGVKLWGNDSWWLKSETRDRVLKDGEKQF